MITIVNGHDTIKTLASGEYRAHRMGVFWVGDYTSFASAERALQIASSKGADDDQRGFYDGGVNATESEHLAAHANVIGVLFGHSNCVTQSDVNSTILVGEIFRMQGGFPVRA